MENDNYVTEKDLEKVFFINLHGYVRKDRFTKEQIEDQEKVVHENKDFLVSETKDGRISTYGKSKLVDLF